MFVKKKCTLILLTFSATCNADCKSWNFKYQVKNKVASLER